MEDIWDPREVETKKQLSLMFLLTQANHVVKTKMPFQSVWRLNQADQLNRTGYQGYNSLANLMLSLYSFVNYLKIL